MYKILSFAASVAANAGIATSVSQDGLTEAKVIIAPYIFAHLANIEVPEVDFDGGKLTDIKVTVPQPDLSNIQVNAVADTNSVQLAAQKVKLTAKSGFKYHKGIIGAHGTADIKIDEIGLNVVIDLATQPGTPAPSLAPKLTVNKLDINVDPKHVDIKLHGGLVTKIASIVIPLIKNSVIPGVIKQVQETATTLIDTTLDDDLKLYGSQMTLPGTDVVVDYGQVDGSPSAKNSVLSLMFNGTTFEAGTPSKY